MKDLEVGQKILLKNVDESKTYAIVDRNDNCENPPEYELKNLETGERHGPVYWQWIKDGTIIDD